MTDVPKLVRALIDGKPATSFADMKPGVELSFTDAVRAGDVVLFGEERYRTARTAEGKVEFRRDVPRAPLNVRSVTPQEFAEARKAASEQFIPTDMDAEIRRLEPLVATAIVEAKRVREAIAARLRAEKPGITDRDLRSEVSVEVAVEHPDLQYAEMIAESRAKGETDDEIARGFRLIQLQGMW